MKWTLEDAILLARAVEAEVSKVGWHVGIAGSVLRDGGSDNDLDLILYPRRRGSSQRPRANEMRAALRRVGLVQFRSRREVRAHWKRCGSNDQKFVESWMLRVNGAQHVDVFILS